MNRLMKKIRVWFYRRFQIPWKRRWRWRIKRPVCWVTSHDKARTDDWGGGYWYCRRCRLHMGIIWKPEVRR